MGIHSEVPAGTTFEQNSSLVIYAFRCGDKYLAYSSYDGISMWIPLLNSDRENAPTGFELEDGEAALHTLTGLGPGDPIPGGDQTLYLLLARAHRLLGEELEAQEAAAAFWKTRSQDQEAS